VRVLIATGAQFQLDRVEFALDRQDREYRADIRRG
jgi:hypothetical protein